MNKITKPQLKKFFKEELDYKNLLVEVCCFLAAWYSMLNYYK